jgi:hypothetical protein
MTNVLHRLGRPVVIPFVYGHDQNGLDWVVAAAHSGNTPCAASDWARGSESNKYFPGRLEYLHQDFSAIDCGVAQSCSDAPDVQLTPARGGLSPFLRSLQLADHRLDLPLCNMRLIKFSRGLRFLKPSPRRLGGQPTAIR